MPKPQAVLPPPAAWLTQVVPFEVSTLPELPGTIACRALAPLPSSTALAVRVPAPVPPLATGRVPVTSAPRLMAGPLLAAVSRPWASTVRLARV